MTHIATPALHRRTFLRASGAVLATFVGPEHAFTVRDGRLTGRAEMVTAAAEAGLFVVVAVLWFLDRRDRDGRTTLTKVVAVLVVIAAVGALAISVLAGHSGATAVWKPIVDNTTVGQIPEP